MACLNNVQIIGYLGKDPVGVTTVSGQIVSLTVATSRKYHDKKSDSLCEDTQWHRVIVFNRQAQFAMNYMKKGMLVYIEGAMKTEQFTDKNGIDRSTTSVIAKQCLLLERSSGLSGKSSDDTFSDPINLNEESF